MEVETTKNHEYFCTAHQLGEEEEEDWVGKSYFFSVNPQSAQPPEKHYAWDKFILIS